MLTGKRTKKKYQIGTPVVVRVRGVNPEKRWIDFEILQLNH
jgi:exoribonuclease R